MVGAKIAGAQFADVRVQLRRDRIVSTREERAQNIDVRVSLGFNVRVLADGTWGFAASDSMTEQEAKRVGRKAVARARASAPFKERAVELATEPAVKKYWKTGIKVDPFNVPTEAIVAKLLDANKRAMSTKGIRFAGSSVHFIHENKLFLSSEGAEIEQDRSAHSSCFLSAMLRACSDARHHLRILEKTNDHCCTNFDPEPAIGLGSVVGGRHTDERLFHTRRSPG